MVCQEEVFSWFKELSGFKRLDVMCGLLNMCLPFELRFFGTCVEDLGKKDFHYLREAENRANNMAELSKLTDLNEDITRSKLIVSLALLDSSNHVCSNIIFNILTDYAKMTKSPDHKIIDEMLLLFTMALYHPAFTFDQKSVVGTQLNDMRRILLELQPKAQNSEHCGKESSGCASEPVNFKYTPVYSHVYPSGTPNLNGTYVKSIELIKCPRVKKTDKKMEFKLQVSWLTGETTEVLKTYQELYDFSHFLNKTCNADPKLQSNEMNIPLLPTVKPGNKTDEILDDMIKKISEFLRSLTKLLPQLTGYECIVNFFQGQNVSQMFQWSNFTSNATSSQGLMVPSLRMPVQQQQLPNGPNQRPPKDDASTDLGRVKSMTIYNSQIDHSGAVNQGDSNKTKLQTAPTRDANNKSAMTNRYNAPYPAPCSTPVISPHSSPISSPFASPSQSVVNSRSASPWIPRNVENTENIGLKQILSQDKLRKYKGRLNSYTIDELRTLSDDELVKEGLPVDAITHLRKKLEMLRIHPMNGLNVRSGEESNGNGGFSMLTLTCAQPSAAYVPTVTSNSTDLTPAVVYITPTGSTHRIDSINQPPSAQVLPSGLVVSPTDMVNAPGMVNYNPYTTIILPHLQQQNHPLTHLASAGSSPSCSEYSSPPGSPLQDNRNNYDSSCSEEIDKDKEGEVRSSELGEGVCTLKGISMRPHLSLKLHSPDQVSHLTNTPPPVKPVMPDIVPVSSNNSITSNSFAKPRLPTNPAPSSSPPALKIVPKASCEVPTTPPNLPVRWEGTASGGSSASLTAATQSVATTQAPQQEMLCYRTCNTPLSPSLVTSATRHLTNTSSRPLSKSIYSQHSDDNKLSTLHMGMSHGTGTDSVHAMPYSTTPISYPNLAPSPGAPAVTCATPAFLQANTCPSNIPQLAHTVLPPTNTCGCSCNHAGGGGGSTGGGSAFSTNFLSSVPVNSVYQYPQYLQSHNTNNFMAPTSIPPPNFHFNANPMPAPPPPHIPNGVSPELVYSGTQFSMLQQNGSQHSTRVPAQGFLPPHNPNMAFHSSYASSAHVVPKAKSVSCYNCGIVGHIGLECKEATMEEITKPGQFRLNYTPTTNRSSESAD